jgi:hypothetical protein
MVLWEKVSVCTLPMEKKVCVSRADLKLHACYLLLVNLKACANAAPLLSEYGLPMDDQELDRMDLCHTKYYALLKQRRFLSPIGENPQRILDIGCGTGNST